MPDTFRERVSRLEDSTTALRLAPYFQDWRGESVDPGLVREIIGAARRLGANPAHLLAIIEHESGFNPKAQFGDTLGKKPLNAKAAQGILQFTPTTLKSLGTTPAAVRAMSAVQQVKLVEKYLRARARERLDGGDLDTFGKVALATFYPMYMGKAEDTLFPARVTESNPGIRTPADYLDLVTGDLPMEDLERIGRGSERVGEMASPPAGTVEERILDLLQQRVNITAQQLKKVGVQANSIRVILQEFTAAGVPLPITLAAIANAFVESKLDPNAVTTYPVWSFGSASEAAAARPKVPASGKTPEDSRGLFMLNIRGAGKGMSDAARHDPATNARRILDEYNGPWGDGGKGLSKDRGDGGLRAAYAAGAPIERLAYLWARDIERPADVEIAEGSTRRINQTAFLGPFAQLVNIEQGARRVASEVQKEAIRETKEAMRKTKEVLKTGVGLGTVGAVLFGGALLLWLASRMSKR